MSNHGVELPAPKSGAVPGQTVIYGIRPEHMELTANGVPATVSVLEPTGAETQIFARVGNDPIVGIVKDRVAIRPGDGISFKIDGKRAHVFDKQTGVRL